MVEHFSKWLELVPLSNHSNEGATYAFLDRLVNRFGVRVEILTDQNEEFHEEFQKLCEKALIDHRTTLQDHFEANMLVEWMV
jgi:transposase-like protein